VNISIIEKLPLRYIWKVLDKKEFNHIILKVFDIVVIIYNEKRGF